METRIRVSLYYWLLGHCTTLYCAVKVTSRSWLTYRILCRHHQRHHQHHHVCCVRCYAYIEILKQRAVYVYWAVGLNCIAIIFFRQRPSASVKNSYYPEVSR